MVAEAGSVVDKPLGLCRIRLPLSKQVLVRQVKRFGSQVEQNA
jgi:hypothetical protein